MPGSVITPCEYARQRHQKFASWRNRWTLLIFVFGAAVVAFLVAAILLFIREAWLPATISTLFSIVSGAGIKWVVDRRVDAVREEEEAYKDVCEKCQ